MGAAGRGAADSATVRRVNEDALARDIVDECRVQLMLKFRFLDLALWRMEIEPMRVHSSYALATDAKRVYCDPPREIARFQESLDECVRDYLHLIMHCIFRHPFDENHVGKEAWNLTCDIIVENAVMEMCGGRFESADDAARRSAVDAIRMCTGGLLPGKVYSLLNAIVQMPDDRDHLGFDRSTLNTWHDLFERCDHGAWPANAAKSGQSAPEKKTLGEVSEDDAEMPEDGIRLESPDDPAPEEGEGAEGEELSEMDAGGGEDEGLAALAAPEDSEPEPADDEDADEPAPDEPVPEEGGRPRQPEEAFAPEPDEAEEEREYEKRAWEDIAKEIEMNLETFSQAWGKEAGSLMTNLALANRKTVSYTEFLRRFMVLSEEMLLNMDEYDNVYYTFGMDLYGNMPLIEPLEYKETERVRDFAIVIDTSESVSGELVRLFVEHTFAILKSSQDYTREVNVHIIQCDSRVHSDMRITNLDDVDKLLDGFVVRGFGGTDFRPAFDYVDALRKSGDLENMRGLIYFTDGLGQFPERPPDYDTAFVFMDDESRALPPVPPWAMKVVIDENGIRRLRGRA